MKNQAELIKREIWNQLRITLEAYQKAVDQNGDYGLIRRLGNKVRELEDRLSNLELAIKGLFLPLAVVVMAEAHRTI